jgi:hypothetical protein
MRVQRVGKHVLDLRHSARQDRSPGGLVELGRSRMHLLQDPEHLGRVVVMGNEVQQLTIEAVDCTHARRAEVHGVRDDGVKGRLNIDLRPADHAQDFARGRLLLERVAQGAVQVYR